MQKDHKCETNVQRIVARWRCSCEVGDIIHWKSKMATMRESDEMYATKQNFIARLSSIITSLEPLINSNDPGIQLEHQMYQMDSLCRDIQNVQDQLPDDFVRCVITAYQTLEFVRSDTAEQFRETCPTEHSGSVGRPKLMITQRQLQHLLGK